MTDQEAKESETLVKVEKEDIDSQINVVMRARIAYFKEQSDSLTFEGVRRLLEKDLGMERCSLDVHKRFIKQRLQELLEGVGDGNDSKNCEERREKGSNVETAEKSVAGDEQCESPEGHESNIDASESFSKDADKMNDSPVLGLLTGKKTTKIENKESERVNEKKALSKATIKAALRKRARYLIDNSEQVTLAGLRRLLEEDLELEKKALDSYKEFIKDQVDVILNSCEVSQSVTNAKKNVVKKDSQRKVARKVRSEESSDSANSESDGDEDLVKPRKKSNTKGKDSNESKKRKKPTKDSNVSGTKRIKAKETMTEDNIDAEDNGIVSEDDHSHSSAEKSTKKKVVSAPAPAYGKRVESLKSVIKACGMSVPPSVYKKAKQVSENKREAYLIKELEEMLSKEGLSANPSEKEIKEVRKKKERAKELEGIDMSNIVSSTRRRSTTSFVPPPRPKLPVENDGDNTEEDEDDNDDEDDDDGDSDDSQSEESNEDNDENSD
ncbi:G-patch domain-containing protein 1 [Humulus lupulus]|uniref:G-patch domain-containing protein 1 n=1 Tax=Humulus lupulus TaxID=3486 RepID=UPI002B4011AB|nr:G-patch domain-containing protein 1 [Humulus lupulus]